MTDEASTQRALGSLEASVRHLTETWARQEANASEGRRALHTKFDEFKDRVVDELSIVTSRLNGIDTTLLEVKPAVKEFKSQRDQQRGAMKFGKWLWGMTIAVVSAAASVGTWGIHEWLNRPPGH